MGYGVDKLWGLPKPCNSGKVIITSLKRDLYYFLLSTWNQSLGKTLDTIQ